MDIDNRLPGFRSFMSENKLNNGGVKTSIDQSAVAAGEQTDVGLNLNSEEEKNRNDKNKKKKKENQQSQKKNSESLVLKKSDSEIKATNLKLLNLL